MHGSGQSHSGRGSERGSGRGGGNVSHAWDLAHNAHAEVHGQMSPHGAFKGGHAPGHDFSAHGHAEHSHTLVMPNRGGGMTGRGCAIRDAVAEQFREKEKVGNGGVHCGVAHEGQLAPGVDATAGSVEVAVAYHGWCPPRARVALVGRRLGLVPVNFHADGLVPASDSFDFIPEKLAFFAGEPKQFAGYYQGVKGSTDCWLEFYQIGLIRPARGFLENLQEMFGWRTPIPESIGLVKGYLAVRGATACYQEADRQSNSPGVYETLLQIELLHFEIRDMQTGKYNCDPDDFFRHVDKADALGIQVAAEFRAQAPERAALARHLEKRKTGINGAGITIHTLLG